MNDPVYVLSIFSLDGDCYADISSRLLGDFRYDDKNKMTPEFCQKICFEDKNFQYAGVQYYHECFCGNNAPPRSNLLSNSECNLQCSGDKAKICGGVWKMNIFKNRGKVQIKKLFFIWKEQDFSFKEQARLTKYRVSQNTIPF